MSGVGSEGSGTPVGVGPDTWMASTHPGFAIVDLRRAPARGGTVEVVEVLYDPDAPGGARLRRDYRLALD